LIRCPNPVFTRPHTEEINDKQPNDLILQGVECSKKYEGLSYNCDGKSKEFPHPHPHKAKNDPQHSRDKKA